MNEHHKAFAADWDAGKMDASTARDRLAAIIAEMKEQEPSLAQKMRDSGFTRRPLRNWEKDGDDADPPAPQRLKEQAAFRTLNFLGYTYNDGAEHCKPPLGKAPQPVDERAEFEREFLALFGVKPETNHLGDFVGQTFIGWSMWQARASLKEPTQ